MMKKIILSFLIVSLLMIGGMIVGCSKEETITGGAVIDVSTLTVLVKSDNGTLLDEASVFVNGFYKGKTTKYGSSPGTKTIVLSGTDNLIAVEKEGFITSKPTIVSASLAGEQQLIVVLKQKKTSLEVKVRGEGKLLREARVELENSKGYKQALLTDEKGTAHFERLDDDDYTVHAIKERFAPKEKNITIKYAKDGDEETFYLSLTKLPESRSIKLNSLSTKSANSIARSISLSLIETVFIPRSASISATCMLVATTLTFMFSSSIFKASFFTNLILSLPVPNDSTMLFDTYLEISASSVSSFKVILKTQLLLVDWRI